MSTPLIGSSVGDLIEGSRQFGNYQRVFPGMQSLFKTGNVSGLAGAINIMFGAPVYDQLNRETNAHAIIKKRPWDHSGFRVTTTNPSTVIYGGADPGTVGAVVDATPTELRTIPGFFHTPFDLTWDAGFRSQHDDGLDVWAWKMAIMRDIHGSGLNRAWTLDASLAAAGSTTNTTDAKNDTADTSFTGSQYVIGLESIDRLIASKAENDAVVAGGHTGWFNVYESASGSISNVDRSATTFDSVVCRPDATQTGYTTNSTGNKTFSTKGLNFLLDTTAANGADPSSQVWLTNRTSARKLYDTYEAQGRADMTEAQAKLDMQGLQLTSTTSGRDITFTIRTYQGVPIIRDENVPSTTPQAGTSNIAASEGAGRWYLVDQRNFDFQVGWPTLYLDVDNPIVLGNFSTKALFASSEQAYARRFNTSGKMRNVTV